MSTKLSNKRSLDLKKNKTINVIKHNDRNINKSTKNYEIEKNDVDIVSTNNSIQSISQHEDRPYDTIPFRLEFLKDILQNEKINTND